MIDRAAIDRIIASLQELRAAYNEHAAFEVGYTKAKTEHAKVKAEHDTVTKQLAQARSEFENLKLEHAAKRQRVAQLDADIDRRNGELHRITAAIAQAKQHAFGV
jgi:chromosome segregation ATPase